MWSVPTFHFEKLATMKKKKMNNWHFYNFPRITVAVYFTYFKSIIGASAVIEPLLGNSMATLFVINRPHQCVCVPRNT